MGSRYQDLGQIYFGAMLKDEPEIYETFIEAYQSEPEQVELLCVRKLAGIISFAYAGFGLAYVGAKEFEKRLSLGSRLFDETG